ncbi:zinc finger, CCHC-type containing protein [Tanacetum coccineum]
MPNNGQAVSQLEYSRVIGCLMYAMTCTRSNIAFVVGKLRRYTSNPDTQHCQAIQQASKKQTCITGSTMKFEFVALAAAGKEAEWLRNLILKIPFWSKPIVPISIHCDSAATLAKAYSQMHNRKSRHLGIRHRMIHELITNGVISIEFVRMCLEPAEKEDKVVNFLMVNFFGKVLSRSMNKEEPPIAIMGIRSYLEMGFELDKFKGVDFRRWQKKMHFLLFSMSVVYMLTSPILEEGGDDATADQIRKRAKWDNDDYACRGLILNGNYLRIEESLRVQDSDKPKGNNVVGPSVVNMVEHNNSSRYNDNKGKRKHHDNTKADPNKKSKVTCWKCEKPEHLKKDCKGGKVGNKSNDSGTNIPRPSLRIPNGIEDIGGSVFPEEVTEEVVQQPEPELRRSQKE